MSLFKVLNKTKTPGGERLLKVWIRQPLTDIAKIQERLEIVQAFVDDTGNRKMVHENCLNRIPVPFTFLLFIIADASFRLKLCVIRNYFVFGRT